MSRCPAFLVLVGIIPAAVLVGCVQLAESNAPVTVYAEDERPEKAVLFSGEIDEKTGVATVRAYNQSSFRYCVLTPSWEDAINFGRNTKIFDASGGVMPFIARSTTGYGWSEMILIEPNSSIEYQFEVSKYYDTSGRRGPFRIFFNSAFLKCGN